jgi:2-dehydro-3-deoxyphosphogalactonate aldolase
MPQQLKQCLATMPLVAILRGVTADEIFEVSQQLYASGIRIIEVPLNSPQPFESIRILSDSLGKDCLCGAGTVLTVEQVEQVFAAGGRLVVSPNTDPAVIQRTVELGMVSIPGFATPSEAFAAIKAGATALKLFPAKAIGMDFLKALLEVLPKDMPVVATGGVNPENLGDWFNAGVAGAGIGGDLYKAGRDSAEVRRRADLFIAAYRALKRP